MLQLTKVQLLTSLVTPVPSIQLLAMVCKVTPFKTVPEPNSCVLSVIRKVESDQIK